MRIDVSQDGLSNVITINITSIDGYKFAIDNPHGNFQYSNIINIANPGIHAVYVRDKNGCELVLEDVYVLGYPHFTASNYDDINDTWTIPGFDTNLYSKPIVSIFDRYGKEVYRMNVQDIGWDGIYRGNPLPSTDYWFLAELTDTNGKTTIFKSHFSLIR